MNPNSERFTNGRHFNTVSKLRSMMASKRYGSVSGESAKRLLKAREQRWGDE